MPSLSQEAWCALDPVARWLVSARAAVLVMTMTACILAGLLAIEAGEFDLFRFAMLVIGLNAAHAANNILNDVSDHLRGVDRDNAFRTRYGTQPVEQGFMSPAQARRLALWTLAPGLVAGAFLVWSSGPIVAPFFLAGVLLVFFYNWPLKHYGMGEPTVLVVWGPLMVGGGYASIVGEWSWYVAMISVPYALGPTAVLFGKHIDKIPWDRPRGVRTFPVLVGERVARYLTIALVAGQYAGVAALVLYRFENWPLLISFAAAPFLKDLVPTFLDAPPEAPPPRFPPEVWPLWYSAFAFVHARRFGLLYLAGVALTVVIL